MRFRPTLDPRVAAAKRRLSSVGAVVFYISGKGGVGKTVLSVISALLAARMDLNVGLLDLDLTNPNTHILLGVEPESLTVKEDMGVVPPRVHGVEFMSVTLFTRGKPAPFTGWGEFNALVEILAITRWSELDVLFIDMPPGLGETVTSIIGLARGGHPVIVATPSKLSVKSATRVASLLASGGYREPWLICNMVVEGSHCLVPGTRLAGTIPYDPEVEEAIGNPGRLVSTEAAQRIKAALDLILSDSVFYGKRGALRI